MMSMTATDLAPVTDIAVVVLLQHEYQQQQMSDLA